MQKRNYKKLAKKYRYKKLAKLKKRKTIFRNRFFLIVISVFIIFAGLFFWAVFGPVFQIKKIEIFGNRETETENIRQAIERQITKKIFFFSTKSVFLNQKKEIEKSILENFAEIEKTKIKKKLPGTLSIKIIEREPFAAFCPVRKCSIIEEGAKDSFGLSNGVCQNEKCFLIDKNAVVFREASAETAENYLKIKNLIFFSEIKLGKKILETAIEKILKIKEEIQDNLKIYINEVIISTEKISVLTQEGWEVYFTFSGLDNFGLDNAAIKKMTDWEITKAKAVLEKEIPLEKRKALEYIDLRFTKVYYKYK